MSSVSRATLLRSAWARARASAWSVRLARRSSTTRKIPDHRERISAQHLGLRRRSRPSVAARVTTRSRVESVDAGTSAATTGPTTRRASPPQREGRRERRTATPAGERVGVELSCATLRARRWRVVRRLPRAENLVAVDVPGELERPREDAPLSSGAPAASIRRRGRRRWCAWSIPIRASLSG